jgi:dihydrofolate reductase
MNGMPKYVVSRTLRAPTWNNSTVFSGDPVAEITALKDRVARDILVSGSSQLVHLLAANDLVDPYNLMIFPVLLGSGRKLFPDTRFAVPTRFTAKSVKHHPFGEGLEDAALVVRTGMQRGDLCAVAVTDRVIDHSQHVVFHSGGARPRVR